jgi:hypothetical protein
MMLEIDPDPRSHVIHVDVNAEMRQKIGKVIMDVL